MDANQQVADVGGNDDDDGDGDDDDEDEEDDTAAEAEENSRDSTLSERLFGSLGLLDLSPVSDFRHTSIYALMARCARNMKSLGHAVNINVSWCFGMHVWNVSGVSFTLL